MNMVSEQGGAAFETNLPAVWAFAKVDEEEARELVYQSLKAGKSRFGWSQEDIHDLKGPVWSDWHSKQWFLRQIKPGDWIVHVNCPCWGRCVAVKVVGEYEFDKGLKCEWGVDFRHCIPVDPESFLEFDRRDPNVLPTVNLNPRQRYQRVYAVEDFLKSIDNLQVGSVTLKESETRELFHLREKTKSLLSQITLLLQSTHKGKELERFFSKVFRRVPGVVEVNENGFGWGTDHGADLIVTLKSSIANIAFDHRIVVQVKSYTGDHFHLSCVDQIRTAIQKYGAMGGIILTTAQRTEPLDNAIQKASEGIGKPIDLLAGDEVAKFVMQYSPDLVFDLRSGS